MFCKRHLPVILNFYKNKVSLISCAEINIVRQRLFHTTLPIRNEQEPPNKLILRRNFEEIEKKTKNTYMEMVNLFSEKDHHRRGHVEFIYSALKNMESFGVHKDLEVYKAIIDVLPKGRFIPTNIIQSEFMHYPKQQQCAIDLLEQMEDNAVMPDTEMENMLLNIFGKRGYPLRKYWRMMYWMPKFRNLSPWPVPHPPPNDAFELAKLAIERITSIDVKREVTVFNSSDVPDAIEDTWIVSAQSPTQRKLLAEHDRSLPIYIDGSYRVWLRNQPVNYFVLKANAKAAVEVSEEDTDDVSSIKIPFFSIPPTKSSMLAKLPSVHEQEDGTIFAVCATGTSSKDSLLSWIRLLEKDRNSCLADCPVVFTLKTAEKEVSVDIDPEKDTQTIENVDRLSER